jgi:cytochrome c-type biogenesis protein CcmH
MKAFAFMLLALLSAHCVAREAPPAADDLALERRVVKLTSDLRCLVCQNQSLADSHADLAIDLKNQVRDQMRAGRSDAEIRDYMVARYGDFVLYDPPFKLSTVLLWMGPFVFLLLGLAALGAYLRSRRRRLPQREMTPAEHARAEALLRGNSAGSEPQ